MGAREELLAAANSLARQGLSTFSPADLIQEARNSGCAYPDSTLRTFIVGPMCLNSPDHHVVQYGDLVRVSRGRYRLSTPQDAAGTTPAVPMRVPSPPPAAGRPADAETGPPWYWEGNVQAAVVRHLAHDGWRILRVADTASREHGVDIVAAKDGVELQVEVKGYPSATYTSGARVGEKKVASQPLHARQSFSHALLSALLMRGDAGNARVVIAFPDFETYRNLARRTASPLGHAGIEVWIVHEDGRVSDVSGR